MSQKPIVGLGAGTILALLAFMLFSVADACVRAMNGVVPPFLLCFIGCAIGAIAAPLLFRNVSLSSFFFTKQPWRWWVRGGLAVVGTICSIVAFSSLALSSATALIFLSPIMTAVTSRIFLKERVGLIRWIGFGIGLIGVLVVLRPEFNTLTIGHLCAVVCATCGVGTVLLIRSAGNEETPAAFYGGALIAPLLVSAPSVFFSGPLPGPTVWLPLAGYALCGTMAGICLIFALRNAPASHVGLAQYTQLLWSALFGLLFFGTAIHLATGAGLIIIAVAGFMFAFEGRERQMPVDS